MTHPATAMRHAIKDHLIAGFPITRLEGMIFFAVQSLPAEIVRLRKEGWLIRSRKVPMARVVRRINEQCTLIPPKSLPMAQLTVEEYWVEL